MPFPRAWKAARASGRGRMDKVRVRFSPRRARRTQRTTGLFSTSSCFFVFLRVLCGQFLSLVSLASLRKSVRRPAATSPRSGVESSPIRAASRSSSVVTLLTLTTQACDRPPSGRSEIRDVQRPSFARRAGDHQHPQNGKRVGRSGRCNHQRRPPSRRGLIGKGKIDANDIPGSDGAVPFGAHQRSRKASSSSGVSHSPKKANGSSNGAPAARLGRLGQEDMSVRDGVSDFVAWLDPKRGADRLRNGRLSLAGEFAGDHADAPSVAGW